MKAAITLVDLDDTVFQTLRKCPPHIDPADLIPYAFGADGQPISYATPSQAALIAWLEATTYLVVVTARSTDALFRSRVRFQHAVAAHGGTVVEDAGEPTRLAPVLSAEWHARMHGQLIGYENRLHDLIASVERDAHALDISVRARIVYERDIPLYVVVKHGVADGRESELHAACSAVTARIPLDWTTHINGNNVAYLPPGLGKRHAVEWLLPRLRAMHPDLPVIGIGDSFTDAPFMQLCDFAMTPTQSQLASRLFAPARGFAAHPVPDAGRVRSRVDENL